MTFSSNDSLKTELNAKGYRLTPQRRKIVDIFQALPRGEHISADELYALLKQSDDQHISLSTVYRTLHMMVYMGLLRELELAEGHKHYELNRPLRDRHHHLVCVQCGLTTEFQADYVDATGHSYALSAGYQVLDCQLMLYGLCCSCREASS